MKGAWVYSAITADLPPDLTPLHAGLFRLASCENESAADDGGSIWLCTRLSGHTGRHAAGDGDYILAVWL